MVGKVKVFRGTPIVWAVFTYSFWRRSSLQAVSFLRISWSLNRACVGKGFYYSRDRVSRPSMATWLCSGHLANCIFLHGFQGAFGNLGLIKTYDNSTAFSTSRSITWRLPTCEVLLLFSLSMIVKVKGIERPDSPSCVASFSEKKEALDPLFRNGYVSTIKLRSSAFTLTSKGFWFHLGWGTGGLLCGNWISIVIYLGIDFWHHICVVMFGRRSSTCM